MPRFEPWERSPPRGPTGPAAHGGHLKAVGDRKACSTCREVLPLDGFHRNRKMPDGLHSQCKTCVNSARREWNRRNPERKRLQNLRYSAGDRFGKYGITHADYEAMRVAQGDRCAICHRRETLTRDGRVRELCIDHCHTTGKVRALLCGHCNSALGLLGDDPERMRAAADYVSAHKPD